MNFFEKERVAGLVGSHGVFRFLLNKELGCYIETNKVEGWEYLTITMVSIKNGKLKGPISRFPTVQEQQHVKQKFWGDNETILCIYPKKEFARPVRPWSAVLWKPLDQEIELPLPHVLGWGLKEEQQQ